MARSARNSKHSRLRRWLARVSPRLLRQRLRWVSVRRFFFALIRRVRLWRIARLPRMPLDDDLFELACSVAERTDDILSSIHRSQDAEVRKWFQSIEPKIRDLSRTAFRLIGTAQELRTALARMPSEPDSGRTIDSLWGEFVTEQDPEMQRFVEQTLKTEQRKAESLEQSRRNLRLISVKLGAITSFLDSIYLRVPNVKVLADRHDWFAEISSELDTELRGLEETFEEFRQVAAAQRPEPPALEGWTVDLRRRREAK